MSAAVNGKRLQFIPVTALFTEAAQVASAVAILTAAGVPRDLIEVIVAPSAATRIYGTDARSPGSQTLRFAGIGGLAGLIVGVATALVMISLPDFAGPGPKAIVQLLGPNVTTVVGAALGAVIGRFVPRPVEPRYARAGEEPDSAVVVVRARGEDQVPTLISLLTASGGREPRVETASSR